MPEKSELLSKGETETTLCLPVVWWFGKEEKGRVDAYMRGGRGRGGADMKMSGGRDAGMEEGGSSHKWKRRRERERPRFE